MTSIYKREPKYRSLPSGWDNMDAVKFSNINSIQGLQHVTNPLAAAQNSTYNCKNVYQDESGNLTIRPALRRALDKHVDSFYPKVLRLYHTVNGQILYCERADGVRVIRFPDIGEIETNGGNITIQESDNIVYLLYTSTDGKLQFKQFDGEAISDVEPDMPTNSPDKPVSRLYNLLSDQTKYEIVPVIPQVIEDSLFSVPDLFEYTFDKNAECSILSSGHIVLVSKDKIVVAVPYGGTYKIVEIPTNLASVSVEVYQTKIEESTDTECIVTILYIDDAVIRVNRYTVNFNGSAAHHTYTIPATFSDADDNQWTCDSEYIGYDGNIIIRYDTELYAATSHEFLQRFSRLRLYNNGTLLHEYRLSVDDSENILGFDIAMSKSSFGLVHRRIDTFGNYVEDRRIGNYSSDELSIITFILDSVKNRCVVIGTYSHWYSVDFDDLEHICVDNFSNVDAEPDILPPNVILLDFELQYTEIDGWRSIDWITAGSGIVINTSDNIFYVDTIQQYRYQSAVINETTVALNMFSTQIVNLVGTTFTLRQRSILPQYVLANRPVSDDFPVLSEIEDNVLTSFYLDNIYWFVTKHRVFGTGVANEQFSIKYFDPRKYFHFDETLTGAIRISDTSFWVFHNNGAYLIYKSSSQIYDEFSGEYIDIITWLCTSTAESKGCDFENAVITLPVTNYVACVTSDDISSVQMRENVQTDDRILVPMTLGIRNFVASLLNTTESIITGTFRYNALFFLNPVNPNSIVPVLVYNATTESWWYWELPVNRVYQANVTETNIEILAEVDGQYSIYDFYTDYYDYTIGGLTWHIYADRLFNNEPTQIDWFWESAILHFNTLDYKKQLLYTSFTFGERDSSTVSFEYNFEVYDKEYSECSWTDVTQIIERVHTCSNKNIIAKFMYLQLYLKNTSAQEVEFDAYTKPNFSSISFKYRILPGGLL